MLHGTHVKGVLALGADFGRGILNTFKGPNETIGMAISSLHKY